MSLDKDNFKKTIKKAENQLKCKKKISLKTNDLKSNFNLNYNGSFDEKKLIKNNFDLSFCFVENFDKKVDPKLAVNEANKFLTANTCFITDNINELKRSKILGLNMCEILFKNQKDNLSENQEKDKMNLNDQNINLDKNLNKTSNDKQSINKNSLKLKVKSEKSDSVTYPLNKSEDKNELNLITNLNSEKCNINEIDNKVLIKDQPLSPTNKRKIDLQVVASRKSARIHETQSFNPAKSIYLFETLRKRSSSISSTNSSTNSDLINCVNTKVIKEKSEISKKEDKKIPSLICKNRSLRKLSKKRCFNSGDPIMDDCTAAMVLMSLSCSPKSCSFKDHCKIDWKHLINKKTLFEHQVPNITNRIAMSPKQRFKQEQKQLLKKKTILPTCNSNKPNLFLNSAEEGFDEEFSSGSDEDEIVKQNKKLNISTNEKFIKPSSSLSKMKCNTLIKPNIRMVFQCTWRNCGYECDVREQMEEHVRLQHLGITSCTEDHEEDFYYTELELDSPIDSSGVSSAGQSPMHEPSNNVDESFIPAKQSNVFQKQFKKRGSKSKTNFNENSNKLSLNSAVATWMHMDMARPAHEDPEYKSKIANKRERKRHVSRQYASEETDFDLTQQQHYLRNLTAEQLVKLQQQNSLHLKNNLQHLQQSIQRHHQQQLHQLHLHQYQQQAKRKYKNISQSISNDSILMSTTRTKSVICNKESLISHFDQNNEIDQIVNHNSYFVKRSKPIKIPGISLAHRDAVYQPPHQSPSFTVGSVQLSPNGYFHSFSPTPPHSLSSPTSSNSSMYSLGSCNSPGSSSIASNSSSLTSYSGSSSFSRNSAHYSPIDTLLQTVENERMQQQLAMEDEPKRIHKLKSANVSDLDLIAQNDEEELDSLKHEKTNNLIIDISDKNELESPDTIKCFNYQPNPVLDIKSQFKLNQSSVIKNGQEALLMATESLTVDTGDMNCGDLETQKHSQLVQTAQQALVTLASTASKLCNTMSSDIKNGSQNKNTNSMVQNNDLSSHQNLNFNQINNNSTNKSASNNIINSVNNFNDSIRSEESNCKDNIASSATGVVVTRQQTASPDKKQKNYQNGLLVTANLLQVQNESSHATDQQIPQHNYLVSQSGRTIKPTAAAKSYVQRKYRSTKYMRTQNTVNNLSKQNIISQTKTKNLIKLDYSLNSNQTNTNSSNLNSVRNSIISSVGTMNNQSSTEQQQQIYLPVQRTPTGRIRNSGAKCRKKYGMENKHQWCVQCRWKKACSRVDSSSGLLNLTQYNNSTGVGTTERTSSNRGRPGRPSNNSNNTNHQRAVTQDATVLNSATDDYQAMAEDLIRTGTLLNNQHTVVSAK